MAAAIFFQHTETLPTSGLAWELQRSQRFGGLSKCCVFGNDWRGTHGKRVVFGAGGSHVNRAVEFYFNDCEGVKTAGKVDQAYLLVEVTLGD